MVALFEIVLPIFALVAIGYGVARTPAIGAEGLRGVAEFVYWVAIPACCSVRWRSPPRRRARISPH